MTEYQALADDLLAWVENVTNGTVTDFRRHPARREAWQITVRRPRNGNTTYFLRLDRAAANKQVSSRSLRRETVLIQALQQLDIPTQSIVAWNDKHCAALQSWVAGTGHLPGESREIQHRVMMEFMEILARLHRVDIKNLKLPGFQYPATALEHSLLEIEAIEEAQLHPQSACSTNPLAAFGKRWLINHAPTDIQATVLLQGDTGPANFLSKRHHVTALVDWEWGHFGDPMEDLANVWVRDFFNPSCGGDLRPYFEHYAACSGLRLDRDSIAYYRVHQLVRSLITLDYLTEHLDWTTPLPLNFGYRAVSDLETCAAMAELAGVPVRAMPVPTESAESSTHATLADQIQRLIVPQLSDAFTVNLAQGHANMLRYLELKSQHQQDFNACELESLQNLLGQRVRTLAQGRQQLIKAIESLQIGDEEPILQHLYSQAIRQAQLMAPLTKLWQQCRWARV